MREITCTTYTTYLLICTCRWRDEKLASFNFPYLCWICHVLLWTSAQYPYAPPSWVTCSNGPRLCGWRTISGELFWRWALTPCNYDLAACADCPPSGRIADNPHFPFLLTICTFRLSPLVSSFPPELSNSVFLGAAHNSNSSDQQPSLLLFSGRSQDSRCHYGGLVTMPGYSTL